MYVNISNEYNEQNLYIYMGRLKGLRVNLVRDRFDRLFRMRLLLIGFIAMLVGIVISLVRMS